MTAWSIFISSNTTNSLTLIKRIRSIIDKLPPDFEHSQQSEPQLSEHSGLSRRFDEQALEQESGRQSSQVDLQPITPDTSTSMKKPASKRRKEDKQK